LKNPTTGMAGCARAASGRAATDPAIPAMTSRRRIAFPKLRITSGSQIKLSKQERGSVPQCAMQKS
jgi:hypothetical protein